MNLAFQEALAARLLWVDVVVVDCIGGSEDQLEKAIQAAHDAVHKLAENDVLIYRHYGPRAPHMFLDIPELADQYNLAHEAYTQSYYTNYHDGDLVLDAKWLAPAAPLALPYSEWIRAVNSRVRELEDGECSYLQAWARGMDIEEAAQHVVNSGSRSPFPI
ncbi:hypothetical protein [Pseudomonas asiatica]|uniref:hypothetical protein n=1 Tax=Pseudomonas asiatica TaxID=2219225 RepID=UPI0010BFC613|nr:hypothetical protein [Pseudomonas asiatica]EKT4528352.1 hypothetical protein [Pseudomonas putida]